MKTISIFLIALIPAILTIEIKIIEEDFIEMPFGGEKRAIKLLIDPTGQFTYIFRNLGSSTKQIEKETYSFENMFGKFEGHWESDYIFPTPDRQFGFKLKYLYVDNKDSPFDIVVDGVLGLGYSDDFPENTNIHKILSKMTGVFKYKKVMTYDKKNSRLVLGTVPEPDSFNPVDFNIMPNEDISKPVNLVNLTNIGIIDKKGKTSFIPIGQKAKFGLMPLIVAPKQSKDLLNPIFQLISSDNKVYYELNKKNLYEDILFDHASENVKPQGIFAFGKIGYKYAHTWKDQDGKLSSSIRVATNDHTNYWYIGIDKLNINRADFDFEKMKVTLYSPNAYEIGKTQIGYILVALLVVISFTVVLAISIRYCCPKKRQKDIPKGREEELIYL